MWALYRQKGLGGMVFNDPGDLILGGWILPFCRVVISYSYVVVNDRLLLKVASLGQGHRGVLAFIS